MKEHFRLFNTTDSVIVHNPTEEDYIFMVGGEREYVVKAGQFKLLHGTAAMLYVKKMVDAYHIQNNKVTDLNNKDSEAEAAKLFVKNVVDDGTELDEKALADLIKNTKATDAPAPEPEPTKTEVQEKNETAAMAQDKSPAKEAEFPDVTQKSNAGVAKA